MKTLLTIILSLLFIASANLVRASDEADALARAFVTICVETLVRSDEVKALAAADNWKTHSETVAGATGPQGKTWLVPPTKDTPAFLVWISETVEKQSKISSCSVLRPAAEIKRITEALVTFMGLGAPHRERPNGSGGSSNPDRIWIVQKQQIDLHISASGIVPPNLPGATLSAMKLERLE